MGLVPAAFLVIRIGTPDIRGQVRCMDVGRIPKCKGSLYAAVSGTRVPADPACLNPEGQFTVILGQAPRSLTLCGIRKSCLIVYSPGR